MSPLLALPFVFVALLAACQPDPESVATPTPDVLLAQPFPGWKASGKSQVRDVLLKEGKPGKIAEQHPVPAQITPIEAVRLDPRHVVVLTQAAKLNHYNEPEDCHACAAWLGAYFFELGKDQWRLRGRQDAVLPSGVYGDLGSMKVQAVAGLGHVAAIEWGSCWGGYCGSWLTLVSLSGGRAGVLVRNLPLHAENLGAHLDCDGETAPPDEPSHLCFSFTGKWRFEGSALLTEFSGWERPLDANGKPQARRVVSERARYALQQGEYVLSEGRNPVPPL